jgi:hypothetical protein
MSGYLQRLVTRSVGRASGLRTLATPPRRPTLTGPAGLDEQILTETGAPVRSGSASAQPAVPRTRRAAAQDRTVTVSGPSKVAPSMGSRQPTPAPSPASVPSPMQRAMQAGPLQHAVVRSQSSSAPPPGVPGAVAMTPPGAPPRAVQPVLPSLSPQPGLPSPPAMVRETTTRIVVKNPAASPPNPLSPGATPSPATMTPPSRSPTPPIGGLARPSAAALVRAPIEPRAANPPSPPPAPRSATLQIGRINVEVQAAAPPQTAVAPRTAPLAPRGVLSGSALLGQRFGFGQI